MSIFEAAFAHSMQKSALSRGQKRLVLKNKARLTMGAGALGVGMLAAAALNKKQKKSEKTALSKELIQRAASKGDQLHQHFVRSAAGNPWAKDLAKKMLMRGETIRAKATQLELGKKMRKTALSDSQERMVFTALHGLSGAGIGAGVGAATGALAAGKGKRREGARTGALTGAGSAALFSMGARNPLLGGLIGGAAQGLAQGHKIKKEHKKTAAFPAAVLQAARAKAIPHFEHKIESIGHHLALGAKNVESGRRAKRRLGNMVGKLKNKSMTDAVRHAGGDTSIVGKRPAASMAEDITKKSVPRKPNSLMDAL